jgi:hypothetical protein
MGTYCNLKTLLGGGVVGGTIWVGSFFMESNGALHWEMMKKVEQKALSLSMN